MTNKLMEKVIINQEEEIVTVNGGYNVAPIEFTFKEWDEINDEIFHAKFVKENGDFKIPIFDDAIEQLEKLTIKK